MLTDELDVQIKNFEDQAETSKKGFEETLLILKKYKNEIGRNDEFKDSK